MADSAPSSSPPEQPDFNADRHRSRTDRELLLGGFGLLLVIAAAFAAVFVGGSGALVAAGIVVGAAVLVGLLYLLISGMERLAR
jgi:hypothetical protein